MIEIKQAVQAAIEHISALYSGLRGLQLEEVYLSEDDRFWLVTLSFLAEADEEEVFSGPYGMLAEITKVTKGQTKRLVRKYKTLEVDQKTGAVKAMKIRPVPSV
ncbi:MAG TPA: hypothetical protein VH107_01795 [Lacipirellulaceae bacterium]|jgi:DNA integrity scanning protein DisA with diadenylate cyclase activity|nr:hypothetical protein [Lacipirellulaceae bacterium]